MQDKKNAIVYNFQKFFFETKVSKVVIGLSGGVDSACSLALAVEAIGFENVHALLMPFGGLSSDENLADAKDLAEGLKVDYKIIDIRPFCECFFDLKFAKKQMTKGNLMARVRMNLLYMLANELDALVVGTCNKTEILTGFFTKYGDGGADFEMIGDLWKCEVYEVGKILGLPESFLIKKPTAELYHGQYDEDEMGVSYEKLDQVLPRILNEGDLFMSQDDQEKLVWDLYKSSAHKRSMPPVIKAS